MLISAVVGAGFATGAELVAFFETSALPPVAIALMVGVFLFCVMGALVLLPRSLPRKLFTPVFFVFFVAMTAGVTELVGPVAAAVAVTISVLIVLFGFERMLDANKILMCFALAVLMFVVIINFDGSAARPNQSPNLFATAGSALLYAGMNCCLLPAILAQAKLKHSRGSLLASVFIACVIISFFVLLMLTAIRVNNVSGAAMPILALSSSLVVASAVFICILTSMFAALFNLQSRGKGGIGKLCIIAVAGYALSFLGFTKVIGIFYPIVGAVAIVSIIFSFFVWLKDYYACQRNREH